MSRLPKIMIHWEPEGRKKRGRPRRTWKEGDIQSHEWKRPKNGRMEQQKAMEYGSRKVSSDVVNRTICIVIIFLKSKREQQELLQIVEKYDSCWQLFKQLQIPILPSQCLFSLLVFVAKNKHLFLYNSDIHDKNTHHTTTYPAYY
jgi:hypothetical protein